jgi:tetratricopeptide (TPR) repeat protein
MTTRFPALAAALLAIATFATAQKNVPKKEYDAYMAVAKATNPDQCIEAADKFVESFADSTLKSQVLFLAADAAERKGDIPKALTYAQNSLDADPKNYEAMLLISGELARTTKEHDLDMEEKLTKADKLANDAIEAIKTAQKPNPKTSDADWEAHKKDRLAMAHTDLGMAAYDRKKYDVAITEFKSAVDSGPTMDPTTMIRLAGAYDAAGKPDDAIKELDTVLAMPNLNPALKPYAESEKKRAEALKAAKK